MNTQPKTTEIVPVEATAPQKFVSRVQKLLTAQLGGKIQLSELHQTLAQHLYVAVDRALAAAEIKRNKEKNPVPFTWANVNLDKLAMDAMNRVSMELDAFLPATIYPICYYNARTGKYDIDLRIGYMGQDSVKRKFALDPILALEYKLVHEGDTFTIDRSLGYDLPMHAPANYFKPGEVIGGYGYIQYANPRQNRIIIVEYREFEKAIKASGGVEFWGGEQKKWVDRKQVSAGYDEKFRKEMMYKTVVLRVCAKIALDSKRINVQSYEDGIGPSVDIIEAEIREEVSENANTHPLAIEAPANVDAVTGETAEAVTAGGDDALPF